MKKQAIILGAFITCLILISTTIGCGGSDKNKVNAPAEQAKEQYQCPMKCTEEIFDKPGKCPVCEMELEKIVNS